MLAAAGGGAVVPVVRWGCLSSRTVVASVQPPVHRDHPALEWKVVSPSISLSRREGWEEVATEWTSTTVMKLKTKNDKKILSPPFWRAKCQSGFTTLPPALLQEQPAVVLYLEMALVSWLLAKDKHGEHSGLHSWGHRSATPYVHRRRELYCSSLGLPRY
jgi:hypothetical protein